MSIESRSPRDPNKLYPEHYAFGKSEPVQEGMKSVKRPENFLPVNITVIRHNTTLYKELQDPSFKFDPSVPDLTPETLDLTDVGIAGMRVTAEDLATRIDPEKEVVYVVTSPQYRAQSSLLVLVDELKRRGIEIINDPAQIKARHTIVPSLQQNTFIDPNDASTGTEPWIKADTAWRNEDPEVHKRMPPHLAHKEIAKILGRDLSEILNETHAQAFQRFMRALRHAANIESYLTEDIKATFKGKKLRIIALTHEELPSAFLQHAFDAKENLKNGQVIEIESEGPMLAGAETIFDTRVYPLRANDSFTPPFSSEFPEVQERRVSITFSPTNPRSDKK